MLQIKYNRDPAKYSDLIKRIVCLLFQLFSLWIWILVILFWIPCFSCPISVWSRMSLFDSCSILNISLSPLSLAPQSEKLVSILAVLMSKSQFHKLCFYCLTDRYNYHTDHSTLRWTDKNFVQGLILSPLTFYSNTLYILKHWHYIVSMDNQNLYIKVWFFLCHVKISYVYAFYAMYLVIKRYSTIKWLKCTSRVLKWPGISEIYIAFDGPYLANLQFKYILNSHCFSHSPAIIWAK